jgi:hypothetical protein
MDPFFSNVDEIEATIYQTHPEDLQNLAQVNVEIFDLLNSKKVLKVLAKIYQLARMPESFGEFMAWIKCKNASPIECVKYAMKKGYINLFLYFYLDDKNWQEQLTPLEKLHTGIDMTIWILEQGDKQLLEVALDPHNKLTDQEKIGKIKFLISQLAYEPNSLALLIRLVKFYSLDITDEQILSNYIDGIFDVSTNVLLELKNLKNYLNNNNILNVKFYNAVAKVASEYNSIDILFWSMKKGANNYYEILINLLAVKNYKIIYQILSEYENNIATDVIDSFLLELFGETPFSAWERFSDPDVDLNLLLRLIKEKFPDIYQKLLTDYLEDESDDYYSEDESDQYHSKDESDDDY